METIRSTNPQIRRKATVSDNAPLKHVVFWINEEQASRSKRDRMYKTMTGARKAAREWVEAGK